MRKPARNIEEEDATSMGGWLFADSFLALMVIFLATISFVPGLGGSISSAGNIGNIAGNNYVKGLNLVYEDFDPIKIDQDMRAYAQKEGIDLGAQVIYAKVVGGFDAATEGEDDGRFRALMFSAKLKTSELSQFATAKIDLGASKILKKNQVALRLTLG